MDGYRAARGADGRKAFAIPLDLSSQDEQFRKLDRLSMAEFMRAHGWDSAPLLWYVEYCCRDDYGTNPGEVSAWAGVHYFAARDSRAGGRRYVAAGARLAGGKRLHRSPAQDAACTACLLRARVARETAGGWGSRR